MAANQTRERIAGVWTVLILPFLILGGFLSVQNQPVYRFAAYYWLPIALMTALHILPPPWRVLTERDRGNKKE
ncbi:MAG: hypothetical protein SVY41_01950 [Candidatus Nanohaloarchaea archaeon]|nr:hypothetical protein [Candidatus Nanohaloarchaea archaeon]